MISNRGIGAKHDVAQLASHAGCIGKDSARYLHTVGSNPRGVIFWSYLY